MADRRLSKIQLLVVDNDEVICGLLSNTLKKIGFSSIAVARDGFEAVKLLRNRNIDLIITDWELRPQSKEDTIPANSVISTEWGDFPPYNGASFVHFLRRSCFSPNHFVPVIMLTSFTQENCILYAQNAGVNEIIVKPISAMQLCTRITDIIEKPRPFVTCETYKGPCRRRKNIASAFSKERRLKEIRVISCNEFRKRGRNG